MTNDTTPGSLPNAGPMFERGDCVRHLMSSRHYIVLQSPPIAVIEQTGEAAYIYRSADHHDPRWWVRTAAVMEDGRFCLHRKSPLI